MQGLHRAALGAALGLMGTVGAAEDRPQVVAVNYALQHLTERVLGDGVDVVFPVPAGVDPSYWRPAIADISMIQGADLIVLNGAGFATWVDRVSLPRARIVNTSSAIEEQFIVTETITHSHGDGGEHAHEGLASYVWLNPTLALAQAEAIAAAATRRNLAPADDIAANLDTLRTDLNALDARLQMTFETAGGEAMIATHPRYQYFARRYGLEIASLDWEAGAAPTPEQLTALQDLASKTGATTLIWEATPPDAARDAVRALGLRSVVFEPMAQVPESGDYGSILSNAAAQLGQSTGN